MWLNGWIDVMMVADLDDLLLMSCLCPGMRWSASTTRRVVIARDGNVLRLYWMPVSLWLDRDRAELFIDQLNLQ